MGNKTTSTDFQTNVLASITTTADNAKQRMLAKQAEYNAAKLQEEICNELRYKMEVRFKEAKAKYERGQDSSGYQAAKAQYNSIMSNYTSASQQADILRFSLQDSISYSSKMNNSAMIANSILT